MQALATLLAGLVILLACSTVSPELHAWLHGTLPAPGKHVCAQHAKQLPSAGDPRLHDVVESEHGCAVTLFARGLVSDGPLPVPAPAAEILRAVNFRAIERLALAQPRFLHLPPQAPPRA